MTLEEIREQYRKLHLTYREIAKLSGIPAGTVQKVLGGITKSPRYDTVYALEQVIEQNESQKEMSAYEWTLTAGKRNAENSECVREAAYASYALPRAALSRKKYPRQGEYTLEDYLALPDDQRVELIDGVFYDMASPRAEHQLITGMLCAEFLALSREHPGCTVFVSPFDVQLDRDDRTIVEPDILIVCDKSKITRKRIFGAPDLVVEVLSPSSRRLDLSLKNAKYLNAGVREYWIVDPKQKCILVYYYGDSDPEDDEVHLYGFGDRIPIGISGGKCEIDFSAIRDQIAFLDDVPE